MYILYMPELFKTMNTKTISLYFFCYCNNKIAMPIQAQQ